LRRRIRCCGPWAGYEQARWERWEARDASPCPACEAPTVQGIATCVECGFQLRRLVHSPDSGKWSVRVVTPYMAHEPDVWFERNFEPQMLEEEAIDGLVALLKS
jgi:hypothetical protein